MFKLLFTGVGRRIELLQAFREASLNLNIDIRIYGADMAGSAPALCWCDETRKVCAMRDPGYIDDLITICKNDNIDLLIPTIDTDLLVLSHSIDRFAGIGTRVLISDPDMISVCRDKNYTSDFFLKCGLKAPRTYNDTADYDGGFPAFIKPKDGSSSINAYRVDSDSELSSYAGMIEDYIIQPFVSGTEYTVDIFCDFEGNPVYITPRIRLAVRAGEVLKTEIVKDDIIVDEMKALCSEFKPCGPITVQLIRDSSSGDDYYIEINPRFGGGAPLSMKAGARSAEAILRLLDGERPGFVPDAAAPGHIYSRFDQSVYIHKPDIKRIRGAIFDLDDTLYPESEYVMSGYRLIADHLGYAGYADILMDHFRNKEPAVDRLLEDIGRIDEKEECIRIYREQMPSISLYEGASELIRRLIENNIRVGIITDGRVLSQRNKILALGINKLIADDDIIITDALGGPQFRKPDDLSFRIMQRRWMLPAEEMIYIGDNLSKDHQGPRKVGMGFVHFNNPDGIYDHDHGMFDYITVNSFSELTGLFRDLTG